MKKTKNKRYIRVLALVLTAVLMLSLAACKPKDPSLETPSGSSAGSTASSGATEATKPSESVKPTEATQPSESESTAPTEPVPTESQPDPTESTAPTEPEQTEPPVTTAPTQAPTQAPTAPPVTTAPPATQAPTTPPATEPEVVDPYAPIRSDPSTWVNGTGELADPRTGISWDGVSPIIYLYPDGTTGTEPVIGAIYEQIPSVFVTWTGEVHEGPDTPVTVVSCDYCGKLCGDGSDGTCIRWSTLDLNCPNCGKWVTHKTCHTCDEEE